MLRLVEEVKAGKAINLDPPGKFVSHRMAAARDFC
jgi:hypothetical protein